MTFTSDSVVGGSYIVTDSLQLERCDENTVSLRRSHGHLLRRWASKQLHVVRLLWQVAYGLRANAV
jgi:hypothetical protein